MLTYISYLYARLRMVLQRKRPASPSGILQPRPVEVGQASVEYALVLLGAALVATLLITWATSTDQGYSRSYTQRYGKPGQVVGLGFHRHH